MSGPDFAPYLCAAIAAAALLAYLLAALFNAEEL